MYFYENVPIHYLTQCLKVPQIPHSSPTQCCVKPEKPWMSNQSILNKARRGTGLTIFVTDCWIHLNCLISWILYFNRAVPKSRLEIKQKALNNAQRRCFIISEVDVEQVFSHWICSELMLQVGKTDSWSTFLAITAVLFNGFELPDIGETLIHRNFSKLWQNFFVSSLYTKETITTFAWHSTWLESAMEAVPFPLETPISYISNQCANNQVKLKTTLELDSESETSWFFFFLSLKKSNYGTFIECFPSVTVSSYLVVLGYVRKDYCRDVPRDVCIMSWFATV